MKSSKRLSVDIDGKTLVDGETKAKQKRNASETKSKRESAKQIICQPQLWHPNSAAAEQLCFVAVLLSHMP